MCGVATPAGTGCAGRAALSPRARRGSSGYGETVSASVPAVRALGFADLEVVAALHTLCFDDPWDADALRKILIVPGGFGCLVLDPANETPGGFALGRVAGTECEVISIGVPPPLRRRGWGAALVDGLLEQARQSGADTVVLEVAEDNAAALALYRARGFVIVGRRPAYYRRVDGPVDAHIMRLENIDAA